MLRAILIFALPAIVTIAGAVLVGKVTGHDKVQAALGKGVEYGFYTAAEKNSEWGRLSQDLIGKERWFLELDLLFPFVFGGAIAMGLLVAWHSLGKPFPVFCLLAPIVVCMAADWSENLLQLSQLDKFLRTGGGPAPTISEMAIRIAGIATAVKWLSLGVSSVLLGWLAVWTARSS